MKHFICDKCDKECSYVDESYIGWIIDLKKYIVLCPNCIILYRGRPAWLQEMIKLPR